MLYALLCYNTESVVETWSREKDDAVMASHYAAQEKIAARGKMGSSARLMPTTTATTLRDGREILVLDGPFAETKEQLLGFYMIECETLEEAIETARPFITDRGAVEIRPVQFFKSWSALK
jgi:hypothetical protein